MAHDPIPLSTDLFPMTAFSQEPQCPICGKAVSLEMAKTDDNGKAIHEDCYLRQIGLNQA